MATKERTFSHAEEAGYVDYSREAQPAKKTDQHPIAWFETVMVVRAEVPLFADGTASFGQALDAHLEERAMEGVEVQNITLNITHDMWKEFSGKVRGN